MLRSPTHIVGHGPTSTHATATSTNPVVKNSTPLHRHIGQNCATTMTTTATTTMTSKNGIILNGGSNNKSYNNLNNNNNNNSNNNNHTLTTSSSSSSSQTAQTTTRTSLFDSCHRKIRLIGGGPVAFLGGLVAKARRKERDGDQSSTDTKLYLEESVLERKLPDADLKALVDLPAGLDYNEWLASHTLALFEHVNLVYGTISEFCTPSGCPDMTGPANRTYLWFDEKGKKTRVAAPQYIDYVMTFTQKTVSDESIFPTKYANEFPSSFESIARKILRLQFHVIAHLYAAHFREIALLGLHTHLNLTFAHLTALHRRFNLIDEKETDVLRDLEIALRLTDDGTNCGMSGGGVGSASNGGTTSTSSTVGSGSCSGSGGSSCIGNSGTASSGIGGLSNISLTSESTISSSQLIGTTGMAVTTMTGTVTGTSEDINLLQCGRIDGDATIKPICTQPEGMKGGFNNDRMDIRHIGGVGGGSCLIGGSSLIGAGGNSIVGGILGSFTSDLIDTGYCSSNSGGGNVNTNNIGGINNTSSNNSSHIGNVLNFNNNHHSSTHNALTANSILQCNSNNSPSSHTTTTA